MNISSKAKTRGHDFSSCDGLNKVGRSRKASVSFSPQIKKSYCKERGARNKLQFLLEAIHKLDIVFDNIECYGQEIPCVRSVRELAQRLKVQLGNDYGAFNRVLEELKTDNVSGIARVGTCVERLRNVVNEMVNDDVDYIQNLEDARQCLGKMTGLVETILNVEYAKR